MRLSFCAGLAIYDPFQNVDKGDDFGGHWDPPLVQTALYTIKADSLLSFLLDISAHA